ncbi:MAG: glycosyl transferase family 2 [Candidatus Pacearchaeota archaeon]|nr:MAG: glycosyl transferase family 2 [Candidatus Pacearchaeota archaeon]
MSFDKEVSIIIPAKNEEAYLPKTLDSLKRQKGLSKMEIIVSVSPETTDKTALIAERYRCKVVEGGRPATARNSGANKASYETLFFLDADTYPENDYFLSKALSEFNSRNLDVAGTFLFPDFVGNGFKKSIYNMIFSIENRVFLKRQKTKKPKMQSGMFFKKDAITALNGFKEGIFGEDSEIAERAVNHNPPFNFGILESCGPLITSVRRYEREGIINVLLKVLYLNAKAEIFGYDSLVGVYDNFYKLS